MPTYWYKARDKFGKAVQGIMGADSESILSVKLKEMGYVPVAIALAREGFRIAKVFSRFGGVNLADLNMFTRQFYTLQKAGLSILSSLTALREQEANKTLKHTIGQIVRDIEAGSSLSAALERHPRIFGVLYVNMIKSGEVSGRLDEILARLAALGEHEEQIRMRIKAASRYPVSVVAAIILGFLVLTSVVIPRFANIFNQFQAQLPFPLS